MTSAIILALIFVQDFGDFLDENSDKIVKLGVNPHCNAASSICSASIINEGDFQRLSLNIKEAKNSELEYSLAVTAVGFDFEGIESISVSFEMPGESVEENAALFSPDKSLQQVVPENWNTVLRLPSTSSDRTDWLAVIRLKSTIKEYHAQFPFHFK